MPDIFRTYKLKHHSNNIKLSVLYDVVKEYRYTSNIISNHLWVLFFKERVMFKDYNDIKHIKSKLSERYKQTCQTQVVGQNKSYISNMKNRFVDIVHKSSLNEQDKIQLFYINKYNLWFHKTINIKNNEISEHIKLTARKIFKILTKNKPNFNNISLILDEKVCQINKNDKSSSFDYWLSISTLNKGKKIYIPLKSNDYFESIKGIIKRSVQVIYKNNEFEFGLVKTIEPTYIEKQIEKVGIDIGLDVFMATELGDLLGTELMSKVKKYDNIISKLVKNLTKNVEYYKLNFNKRYKSLIRKLKQYLKNEINRILNKFINRVKPKEIIIEDLDFKGSNIGVKNNRLLHKFGKGILTKKLDSISQIYDIKITKVNPAYTSQECPNCHYTSKKNRPQRDIFKCKCCGKSGHADVIASKNISSRSSGGLKTNRKKILHGLLLQHDLWRGRNAEIVQLRTLV